MCYEYDYINKRMNIDEGITPYDRPINITTEQSFDEQSSQNKFYNTKANIDDDQEFLNEIKNELIGTFNKDYYNQRSEFSSFYDNENDNDNVNNNDNDNDNNNNNNRNSINNEIENEEIINTETLEDNNENKRKIFKTITIANQTEATREITRYKEPECTRENNNGEIEIIKKRKRKYKSTKNMGRKKKTDKNRNGKFRDDDIRTKVKKFFIKSLINFINILISISPKLDGKEEIQILHNKIMADMKKENLLIFFDLSARAFLSQGVTVKCKVKGTNCNKTLIDKIYKVEETTITNVLDKSIRELFDIFCDKITKVDKVFQNFKRLEYYLMKVLKKEEDESVETFNKYINQVRLQALNFEKITKEKDGRNEKKKILINYKFINIINMNIV